MSPARFLRIFTCFAVLALMVGNTFGQVQSSTHEPVVGVIERVRKPDFTITNADSAGQGIIAYSPDGNYLVVAAGESVRFYDKSLLDGPKADLKRTLSGHALRI
ncbi:MAG TPA: hypothetical protein VFO86_03370, partial [Terriglobia bacterium]|nr:hypothetical protein [Terriglobia bacterium]